MQLESTELDVVCEMVMDLCGIRLDASKKYLIENRLGPVAREYECQSYVELAKTVKEIGDAAMRHRIIDAITVNETLFFRDRIPFQALKESILPELYKLKGNTSAPVRIWSAACSTGQEPYSIAIALAEAFGDLKHRNIQIFATDISDAALDSAKAGRYMPHEVERGLPKPILDKYFQFDGKAWTVSDGIRSLVKFQKANLISSFAGFGKFDVIFCRNVSIYFTDEARKSLFNRLKAQLHPHGYLLVGASEILADIGPDFQPIRDGIATLYRPNLRSSTLQPQATL